MNEDELAFGSEEASQVPRKSGVMIEDALVCYDSEREVMMTMNYGKCQAVFSHRTRCWQKACLCGEE